MKRYDDPCFRGYPMGPEWGRPHRDPNWHDGEYHGNRMDPTPGQGAYGMHRQMHQHDLQGYGGFNGIYDEGPGSYNREGQFEHPYFQGQMQNPRSRPERYDAELRRHVEDGGVRHDTRFLRQYNADSPGLRGGYDRGYGWAPAGSREGVYTNPGPRGRDTDERRYAGYNRGGFAAERGPGLDPGRGGAGT